MSFTTTKFTKARLAAIVITKMGARVGCEACDTPYILGHTPHIRPRASCMILLQIRASRRDYRMCSCPFLKIQTMMWLDRTTCGRPPPLHTKHLSTTSWSTGQVVGHTYYQSNSSHSNSTAFYTCGATYSSHSNSTAIYTCCATCSSYSDFAAFYACEAPLFI